MTLVPCIHYQVHAPRHPPVHRTSFLIELSQSPQTSLASGRCSAQKGERRSARAESEDASASAQHRDARGGRRPRGPGRAPDVACCFSAPLTARRHLHGSRPAPTEVDPLHRHFRAASLANQDAPAPNAGLPARRNPPPRFLPSQLPDWLLPGSASNRNLRLLYIIVHWVN